ncbi:MAG: MFS transporter [Simkaniaceae bacterium]|nr:MFS transporter [Simkaniaceae bacterium]
MSMKRVDVRNLARCRPYLIWGISASLCLYTFLLQGYPSVMVNRLEGVYGIGVVRIGILTSSFFYTYIALQIPAGLLVDKYGPRKVLACGLSLCCAATWWFAVSHTFWEGQLSRMIMGLALSPSVISAFYLVANWVRKGLIFLFITLTECMLLMGGVFGQGGVAVGVRYFGWRGMLMLLVLIGVVMMVLTVLLIRDGETWEEKAEARRPLKSRLRNLWCALKAVLGNGRVWIGSLYGGFLFAVFPAFGALWGVSYFSALYGIGPVAAAAFTSTLFFGAGVGTLILGYLSTRLSYLGGVMIGAPIGACICMASILMFSGMFEGLMFITVGLLGMFCSAYLFCFSIAIGSVSKKNKGVATGFTNMISMIFGAPILQPLIGFLLTLQTRAGGIKETYTTQSYKFALCPLMLCFFGAFCLAFLFERGEVCTERST